MKKLWVIAMSLLLLAFQANAQFNENKIVVSLNSSNVGIDTGMLSSINKVAMQITTPDTAVIGYISDTTSNSTYTLVPEKKLPVWLQSYVDSTYKSFFTAPGNSVTWLIKNFSLSESISNSSVYVHIEAAISCSTPNNLNSFWELDTLLKYTHTASDSYPIPFQNAIQVLMTYSASKSALTSAATFGKNTNGSIKIGNPQTLRDFSEFPIVHDSLINEGAFLTLNQFVNNNPSVTDIIMEADSITSGVVHIYHMNADSTLDEINSLVAVCINGELYGYRNNRLIALERTNNSMLISRYRDPDERNNQAIYMRRILKYSSGNENPFSKEYRCTKPGYQDVIATCIDLDTGDLSF